MQNHDRNTKAPAIVDQTASPESRRADIAQTEATKADTAQLVDGPLFLRCFADAPNAFVS